MPRDKVYDVRVRGRVPANCAADLHKNYARRKRRLFMILRALLRTCAKRDVVRPRCGGPLARRPAPPRFRRRCRRRCRRRARAVN